MSKQDQFRCGTVSIVGRPNVGKSTLLNRLIGVKLSITSRKPQTTRHRVLGIKHLSDAQIVYVDTPGVHRGGDRAMNRYMNRVALTSLHDVDAILFVIQALEFTDEDEFVLEQLRSVAIPVILVVNKVDAVGEKETLLPFLQDVHRRGTFTDVVPVSARKGDNLDALERALTKHLPIGEPMFAEDQLTDRNERFIAAEFIREKLMRGLGQEVPYALTVEIEQFKQEGNLRRIAAVIYVEREGQKRIVIGKKGEMLKQVGKEAREDMEKLFDGKVFLELWVKVREGWSDDERALRSLGYTDES